MAYERLWNPKDGLLKDDDERATALASKESDFNFYPAENQRHVAFAFIRTI
ncbi:MAG: hypothetical protein WCG03_03595 [Kiritimatiellales bacterium]